MDYSSPIPGPAFDTERVGRVTGAVAYHPDGQSLVIGGRGGAAIYSVRGGAPTKILPVQTEVKSVAFSADGGRVALLTGGHGLGLHDVLRVFETDSGRQIVEIDTCGDEVSYLANGTLLVEGIMTARRFDTSVVAYDDCSGDLKEISIAAEGSRIDGPLLLDRGRVFDGMTQEPMTPRLRLANLRAAAAVPGGNEIVLSTGPANERLIVYDRETKSITHDLQVRAQRLQVTRDGRHLLTLEGPGDPQSFAIRDLRTLMPVHESRPIGRSFRNGKISPDGSQLIVVGTENGGVQTWTFPEQNKG